MGQGFTRALLLVFALGPGPALADDVPALADAVIVSMVTLPAYGDRPKPVDLRIAWPAGISADPLPVMVFSHGAGCELENNATLLDALASTGLVTIAPRHLDSRDYSDMEGLSREMLYAARVGDLRLVLDEWASITAAEPALAGRADPGMAIAAGHSLGALLAQMVAGAETLDPATGALSTAARDPRFQAVITVSAPGRLPGMTEQAWAGMRLPALTMTGSEDVPVGSPPEWTAEWRRESFDLTDHADQALIWMADLDHYFGGLVCRREVEGRAPDPAALETFVAAAGMFVKHHFADGPPLDAATIQRVSEGRAELETR